VQRHGLVLPWLCKPLEYHYSAFLSPAPRIPSMHQKAGFLPRLDEFRIATSRQIRGDG
jgi:hypothetical protein